MRLLGVGVFRPVPKLDLFFLEVGTCLLSLTVQVCVSLALCPHQWGTWHASNNWGMFWLSFKPSYHFSSCHVVFSGNDTNVWGMKHMHFDEGEVNPDSRGRGTRDHNLDARDAVVWSSHLSCVPGLTWFWVRAALFCSSKMTGTCKFGGGWLIWSVVVVFNQ